jgi:hypothetical protein
MDGLRRRRGYSRIMSEQQIKEKIRETVVDISENPYAASQLDLPKKQSRNEDISNINPPEIKQSRNEDISNINPPEIKQSRNEDISNINPPEIKQSRNEDISNINPPEIKQSRNEDISNINPPEIKQSRNEDITDVQENPYAASQLDLPKQSLEVKLSTDYAGPTEVKPSTDYAGPTEVKPSTDYAVPTEVKLSTDYAVPTEVKLSMPEIKNIYPTIVKLNINVSRYTLHVECEQLEYPIRTALKLILLNDDLYFTARKSLFHRISNPHIEDNETVLVNTACIKFCNAVNEYFDLQYRYNRLNAERAFRANGYNIIPNFIDVGYNYFTRSDVPNQSKEQIIAEQTIASLHMCNHLDGHMMYSAVCEYVDIRRIAQKQIISMMRNIYQYYQLNPEYCDLINTLHIESKYLTNEVVNTYNN